MAFLNNRMTAYVAPDGFVYDYATPREEEFLDYNRPITRY